VNLGRVTESEFYFLATTDAYRHYPRRALDTNLLDDCNMADTQKDALFKTVQIDALVRRKAQSQYPTVRPAIVPKTWLLQETSKVMEG
jgi:hypothetical protein